MSKTLQNKTIFVIVHTNDMLTPVGHDIIMEVKKSVSIAPLVYSKTLWTAAVESFLEYIRIVYDLFGTERKIGLVIVDVKEKICIHPGDKSNQSWRGWMKMLAEVGPPQNAFPSLSSDVIPGFKSVISLLAATSASNSSKPPVISGGRVIVLGYKMSTHVEKWAEEIRTVLESHSGQENEPEIVESEWNFIDVEAISDAVQSDDNPIQLGMDSESVSAHHMFRQTAVAHKHLHRVLMRLLESQHELVCTLVQNIPMKEDTATAAAAAAAANATMQQNSAMYGVELIHPRAALTQMQMAGLLPLMTMTHKPFCGFSSCIGIRWVTPRHSQDIDYYNTKSVHRVTTADVCNRASCCLANFVLEGRSVALEIEPTLLSPAPPPLPDRPSELLLLTSHSGLLYVHALPAHPHSVISALSAATPAWPSISELANKRLQIKMRTNDFCQLLLATRLVPLSSASSGASSSPSVTSTGFTGCDVNSALFHEMETLTRYWPELTTDTLIFNKSLMPKILELLMKKKLEFTEKSACIGFLQQLIFDQNQSEKSASKKQLLDNKTFKTELQLLLSLYSERSTSHREVLESFDVFSNAVSSLVDVTELLKQSPPPSDVAGSELSLCGLTKMSSLLSGGAQALKALLHKSLATPQLFPPLLMSGVASDSSSRSATGRDESSAGRLKSLGKRSRPAAMLTLRDVISARASKRPCRTPFEGAALAVNGVTELYMGIASVAAPVVAVSTPVTAATTPSLPVPPQNSASISLVVADPRKE